MPDDGYFRWFDSARAGCGWTDRLIGTGGWVLTAVVLTSAAVAEAASLRRAPPIKFPHEADSNSPAEWIDGQMYVFNSAGHPYRSSGTNLFDLSRTVAVTFDDQVNGGRWLEATCRNSDGILYGWYHNEPHGLCPGNTLTAPQIGALRSTDNGAHWTDLGIILRARDGTLRCDARNGYFAGGHGDFCVTLDPMRQHLYLFLSTYAGELTEQGIAMARMDWADRDAPGGKVWKWWQGAWQAPGLGGNVTPIFLATVAWERSDCESFWGPSVHWNSSLGKYVMLLNRAKGAGWVQEGIYLSYSTNLADPLSWSAPEKLLRGGAWYPQVIGLESGTGTDKIAGKVARFFMGGKSDYEIVFQDERTQPEEIALERTGNVAVFSWPAALTNFTLVCSSTPSEGNWLKVTNSAHVVDGLLRLTNDLSSLTQSLFFRLERLGSGSPDPDLR